MEMTVEQQRVLVLARARARAASQGEQQPAAPVAVGGPGSMSNTAIHAFTGGLTDEVGAAGGATGRWLADKTIPKENPPFYEPQDKTWAQHYGDVLAEERGALSNYRKSDPWKSGIAEVGGTIASPLVRALMAKVPAAGPGAGMIEQTLKMGTQGTAIGATLGATNAEGGLAERAEGAGKGAAWGAAFGLGAPVVLNTLSSLGRASVQKILDLKGGLTPAEQKVSDAIRQMAGGDLTAGILKIRQLLAGAGDDAAIVDVAGVEGQRLARAAAGVPGESSQIADDFVRQRAKGRGARMQAAADELAPNKFYENLDDLNAARRTNAKPLYEEAFAPRSDAAGRVYAPWDDRLQSFLNDPDIKKGMAQGIRTQQLEALAEGKPFNFQEYAVKGFDDAGNLMIGGTPNLRAMDAAKRGLDAQLNTYRNQLTGKLELDERGRALDAVRRSLVSKLDEITTDPATGRSAYAEARKAWAGPSQLEDAMWMGRRFMRGDEEMTQKAFEGLSPSKQEAFQLGVRREISGMINKDTQAAPGRFAEKKADLWNRLESIYPPDKFAAFKQKIESEIGKSETDRFINPRAGSQTTPMKEDIADLANVPNSAVNVAVNVGKGNYGAAIADVLRKPLAMISNPNQKTAKGLAEMLLNSDPQKQTQILDALGRRNIAETVVPLLNPERARKLAELMTRTAAPGGAPAAARYGQ